LLETAKEEGMDNWSFGLTMTFVGIGGTFVTLGLLILVIIIFKRLFPVASDRNSPK
jgi:cellobiose-specific phosphotransferase system component IIC